jgi:feruloyl esterase
MANNSELSVPKLLTIALLLSAIVTSFGFKEVVKYHQITNWDSLAAHLKQKIQNLHIKGLTVTDVQLVQEGSYASKSVAKPFTDLPVFCLVAITLKPTTQSDIKIELWMPRDNWNGRLLGTGNGGGAGSIVYQSLAGGIKNGYATVNTDMGTSHGGANGAVGKPEIWADFGYRATHEMTVVAKAIVKLYYGKPQHHAYFVGCSTGGQQALMEAQRFPFDYNGIIAGAPANNRTHLHTGFLLNYIAANEGGKALFSAQDLSFITRKITAAFAMKTGGAPGDNFLTDPRMAQVDFDGLFKSKVGSNDTCLSDAQITALKKIYAGPVDARNHDQIYTSPPVGSENAGGGLSMQQTVNGANGLFYQFKWIFGNDFNPAKFDFDKDQAKLDSILTPVLNANNTDLEPLKKLGGKIIMYTGTADPLVPYQDALNYYERVIARQHGLKQTKGFFRYYLIPGMGHCSGGPGLNGFGHDLLTDLVAWVEQQKAPEKLIATAFNCCVVNGPPRFQRPVFPYPKFPKYIGGDVNAASSYIGVNHPRNGVLKPANQYLN